MSSEENPPTNEPAEIEPAVAELADPSSDADEETVVASISDATPSDAPSNSLTDFFVGQSPDQQAGLNVAAASVATYRAPPPLAKSLQNLSANGGAVGALVLGIWCFAGSFMTTWSIINGFLGMVLGFWGLSSRRQKTAWVGIALCLVGILLSLADISALVNDWWNPIDENSVEI